MSYRSRRHVLQGIGTVGLLAVAGCLGGPPDTPDSDTPGDAPDSTAVLQLGRSFTDPAWSTAPTEDAGYVARYDTRTALDSLLDSTEKIPARVTDFVEATDFDAATILYLQSVGSSTCYNTLEVSNVTITDEAVVATASAVDTSGSNTACGEAISYPSAFVRVSGADLPDATRITVTSGFGTTGEVTAGSETDGDR